MIQYIKRVAMLCLLALGASCIENDIPYPTVEISIVGIEGEGFTLKSVDLVRRVATIELEEATDIQNVQIDKVTYELDVHSVDIAPEDLMSQVKASVEPTGTFNMLSPIYTTLSLYQDYEWTIQAEQTIERVFSVAGQIGATEFDLVNRTATAYVAKDADRSSVTVTALKLGATGITSYIPTLNELTGQNFEQVRFVDVTSHSRTERWLLYVKPTDKSVLLTQVDAWSKVVWLYGEGVEGTALGFRYRKEGDSDWTNLTATVSGGNFSARLQAETETTYEVVAYSGDETTDSQTVTTSGVEPLPNGDFELWSEQNDVVYPYTTTPYWGTGNPGSSIGGVTLTSSAEPRPASEGSTSARLKSEFVSVFGIGKFAAGNMFVGNYLRTEVTNGVLSFGRPFVLRPTKLRVWVKYNCGTIDRVNKKPIGTEIQVGDADNGTIYIALGTWSVEEYGADANGVISATADSPICIDTRSVSTFFDPTSKDVIGYGELIFAESVDEWTQIDIPINYSTTSVVPTHIMVVASSSRYGDYFTGSTQSEMFIDDFELLYD